MNIVCFFQLINGDDKCGRERIYNDKFSKINTLKERKARGLDLGK